MNAQITDSMSMAVAALDVMKDNALRVHEVAMRLLTEHADGLPKLIGVRPDAGATGPRLELQPRTNAEAALWAEALGISLAESFVNDRDGWRQWHMGGAVDVDGVRVHVGACEWVPSAAADASEVAA